MSEIEVMTRYSLNITIVVINNNGTGGGPTKIKGTSTERLAKHPVSALSPKAHYEGIMSALGGMGFYVETPDELAKSLDEALASPGPSLVNCMINPRSDRK